MYCSACQTMTIQTAVVAQLGERQTEDLEVGCSSHPHGTLFSAKLLRLFGSR